MDELTLVRGRARDRAAVDRLLLDVFDVDVRPIAAQGLSDPTHTAFSFLDHRGELVANAAVFALTLMVGGAIVDSTGLQSVATRPAWRRRGVARALLRHVLDWCDGQGRPVLLMTDLPAFYAPLGFAVLPQTAFHGPAPRPARTPHLARRLDLACPDDLALLSARLRTRVAVSAQFAVLGGSGPFLLALLGSGRLHPWWIAGLDCLVVTGPCAVGGVCLVDVAAGAIPALDVILGALRLFPDWVETRFPPDRLGWAGARCPAEALTLMVRGVLPVPDAIMLPETAWF